MSIELLWYLMWSSVLFVVFSSYQNSNHFCVHSSIFSASACHPRIWIKKIKIKFPFLVNFESIYKPGSCDRLASENQPMAYNYFHYYSSLHCVLLQIELEIRHFHWYCSHLYLNSMQLNYQNLVDLMHFFYPNSE